MNDKTNGLILSSQDYKENDLLLNVLTSDFGFVSFIAKGAKKITAKNHFNVMTLYEFMFDYKDTSDIFVVRTSKLVKSYYDDSNMKLTALKNILLQVTLKSKEIKDNKFYDNLIYILERINNDNAYLLSSLYFSYILNRYGIEPRVDGCVICGNTKVVTISNNHGGFLCKEHSIGLNTDSVDTLKKFRLIVKASSDFNNYELIKDTKYELSDFIKLVEFFITNSEIRLSSYDLYLEII